MEGDVFTQITVGVVGSESRLHARLRVTSVSWTTSASIVPSRVSSTRLGSRRKSRISRNSSRFEPAGWLLKAWRRARWQQGESSDDAPPHRRPETVLRAEASTPSAERAYSDLTQSVCEREGCFRTSFLSFFAIHPPPAACAKAIFWRSPEVELRRTGNVSKSRPCQCAWRRYRRQLGQSNAVTISVNCCQLRLMHGNLKVRVGCHPLTGKSPAPQYRKDVPARRQSRWKLAPSGAGCRHSDQVSGKGQRSPGLWGADAAILGVQHAFGWHAKPQRFNLWRTDSEHAYVNSSTWRTHDLCPFF